MIPNEESRDMARYPAPQRFAFVRPQPGAECVPCVTREKDLVDDLRIAGGIVQQIMNSRKDVCELRVDRGRYRTINCTIKAPWNALRSVLKKDWSLLAQHFPGHSFNPYVGALVKAIDKRAKLRFYLEQATSAELPQLVAEVNALAADLRAIGRCGEFKRELHRSYRRCRQNQRSLDKYIDKIFEVRGSRHLVIRIDLLYAMEDRILTGRATDVTVERAHADLEKFFRYVRRDYPLTGGAWRLEYGLESGHHFHVLLFLNGHRVREEVSIARAMGEHWENVITEGLGRYHNCNAGSYVRRGIGMINHYDLEKIAALKKDVASYLTKADFWLRFDAAGRTFGKGVMPVKTTGAGRPRKAAAEIVRTARTGMKSTYRVR